MFEIGDKAWFRGGMGHEPAVPAVVTGHYRQGHFATLICQCEGAKVKSWGYEYQFESRACHLCGAATAEPGCPLCPACTEERQEREQDTKLEQEQRRRPR